LAISHNPIFNRSMATGEAIAQQQKSQAEVDEQFAKLTNQTPMTVEGTAGKVFALFVAVVGAALAATFYFERAVSANTLTQSSFMTTLWVTAIGGAVLMFWAALSRKVRPLVMFSYALVEGVFLGSISWYLEGAYPGIVQQAVIGTLATAGVMFAAYRFGWIKVNARFTRVMSFALMGYAAFAIINLGIGIFNNSAGVYSTGMGWLAGLVGAGLAAFTLNLDFEAIVSGARQQLPRENEWRAAFGLTTTLVWLYVEILRLLSIFIRY